MLTSEASVPRGRDASFGILYATFFATGFSALVYQVIWQRMLALFAGADITSATIVVGAFLGGLGAGSILGGALADRLTSRRALIAFVACNLGIAGFALISKFVFYDLLFLALPSLAISRTATLLASFLALLVPTTLMGLSLPILSRVVVRSIEGAARSITTLYYINTLGAAFGAVLGGWFLVARFGYVAMLQAGALLNAVAGLAVGALLWRSASRRDRPFAPGNEDEATARGSLRHLSARDLRWLGLVILSGFMAISLQILWFRLFAVLLISRAYVFPIVLAAFLFYDALGAALGAGVLARILAPRRAFFIIQGLIAFTALASIWLLVASFGGLETIPADEPHLLPMLVLLSVLIGPPAILIGIYFPLAHKAVQRDRRMVAARTGLIDFGIVIGNTLGCIVTGLVLLDAIGTTGTLRLLAALAGVFVAAIALERGASLAWRASGAALLVLLATCAFALPGQHAFWTVFSRAVPGPGDVAFTVEDKTAVAVVIRERQTGAGARTHFITNLVSTGHVLGRVEPFLQIHGFLGAVGSLVHPDPKEILIIGLGSAGTAYAAGVNPRTERIDVIEIAEAQHTALDRMLEHAELTAVREVIRGPRYRIIGNDGRRHLQTHETLYDIIEADPLMPETSGSGMLYSTEFFQLARSRLKPGGLLVQWTPTARVANAVMQAFPHGVAIGSGFMIASEEFFEVDAAVIRARFETSEARRYLALGGLDVPVMQRELEPGFTFWGPDDPRKPETNTDLFPHDEYAEFARW